MMANTISILHKATRVERALEQVSGERWSALDIDIIRRARDPWTCPEHLLPQLAYQHSVDIWDENWPIEKKRQVIADAPEDHHLKTTEEGAERYLRHAGGRLERVLAAPQGAYPMGDWSDEERASFFSQLDHVRVHRYFPVDLEADGFFASESFADEDFCNSEPPYFGYRKHAVLFRADGETIDLDVSWQYRVDVAGHATEIETIRLPAVPDAGLYADSDFADEDYLDIERVGERTIQTLTGGAYHYAYDRAQFGIVFPDGGPVSTEPELVFDTAINDGCGTFADADFIGDGSLMADLGWQQIYERYWMNNPAANLDSIQTGGCYYDDAWYGWSHHTAVLTVEMIGRQDETGADECFDLGFFLPPELDGYWKLAEAAHVSKGLSDAIFLDTATYRWPRLGDRFRLDGSWPLGEMIKDR